jgi:dolichol-phosphate mannosyltransferase
VLVPRLVEYINATNEKNSSIFPLIHWLGYEPTFVPITRRRRELGRSQWSLARMLAHFLDILIGFTYVPSRVITGLGLIAAFLSLAYFAYLLVQWSLYGNAPPGWMTSVSLQLLIGSLILVSLGMISEYLVRIPDETRKRPLFVVDERDVHASSDTDRG